MKVVKMTQVDGLQQLCDSVRCFCKKRDFEPCLDLIYLSMAQFPDAPEPHNLLGVVLEQMGDHLLAMKHFRAAWALDPTYRPANQNLHNLGTFSVCKDFAYDERDLEPEKPSTVRIVYDEKGIGHAVRIKTVEFDEKGVAHLIREEEK